MSAKLLRATASLLAQGFTHEQAMTLLAANPVAPTTRNPDSPAAVRQRAKRANLARTSGEQVAPPDPQGSPTIRPKNTGKTTDPPGLALALARPVSERDLSPSGISGDQIQTPSALPSGNARETPTLFASSVLAPTDPDPVDAIWVAYLAARRGHGVTAADPKLTPERRALIRRRVEETSVDLVRSAGERVWLDPWAGQQLQRCSPEYVWRNVVNVERYGTLEAPRNADPDAWSPQERAAHAEWAKTHPPVPLTFPLARVPDMSVPNVVDDDMRDLAATMGRDPHELCAEMERYRMSVNGEPS